MNNIAQKYNRILILLFSVAPFVAFFARSYLNMSFNKMMQVFSYLGVFLLLLFKKKLVPLRFPNYLIFYFLFILYVFYSDLFLLNREFKVSYLFSNLLIGGFNMMFIIENLHITKKYYRNIIKISKGVLLLAFLAIIIQQVINKNFFVNTKLIDTLNITSSSGDRLPSIYSWISGITIGFGFIPIFILIIEDLDRQKRKILFLVIFGMIFSILTRARWIMVNSLLVLLILFINHKDKSLRLIKYSIVIPLLIVTSFFALELSGIRVNKIISDRILESDKINVSQKSAGTRILAFYAFNEFFWDNPIFGNGNIKYGMGAEGKHNYKLSRFLRGRSSQMHVGYLALFYRYGLIGGGLFLSFLFLLLKKLYKNAKITGIWAPFLGILGFALANLTLVYFSVFQMGLILVLAADKYYISMNKLNKN